MPARRLRSARRWSPANCRSTLGTRRSIIRPWPTRSSTASSTTPISSRSSASRCGARHSAPRRTDASTLLRSQPQPAPAPTAEEEASRHPVAQDRLDPDFKCAQGGDLVLCSVNVRDERRWRLRRGRSRTSRSPAHPVLAQIPGAGADAELTYAACRPAGLVRSLRPNGSVRYHHDPDGRASRPLLTRGGPLHRLAQATGRLRTTPVRLKSW